MIVEKDKSIQFKIALDFTEDAAATIVQKQSIISLSAALSMQADKECRHISKRTKSAKKVQPCVSVDIPYSKYCDVVCFTIPYVPHSDAVPCEVILNLVVDGELFATYQIPYPIVFITNKARQFNNVSSHYYNVILIKKGILGNRTIEREKEILAINCLNILASEFDPYECQFLLEVLHSQTFERWIPWVHRLFDVYLNIHLKKSDGFDDIRSSGFLHVSSQFYSNSILKQFAKDKPETLYCLLRPFEYNSGYLILSYTLGGNVIKDLLVNNTK